MASHFVRTLKPHLTIDGRTVPEGSVVEVDAYRRKALVEHGHAENHDGPASEPTDDQVADVARSRRARSIEHATKL